MDWSWGYLLGGDAVARPADPTVTTPFNRSGISDAEDAGAGEEEEKEMTQRSVDKVTIMYTLAFDDGAYICMSLLIGQLILGVGGGEPEGDVKRILL